jgi:mannose-1-phosphate guanylyltransferase
MMDLVRRADANISESASGTMTNYERVAVILAGGSGERFWPLSRRLRPKQLLCLTRPNETMLGEAVRRISGLIPPQRVFVITSRALVEPIRAAGIGTPPENIVGEPCKRNTCGALVYAAAELLARLGEGAAASTAMAVLTADHAIADHEGFRATVDAALAAAERRGALVTIGIRPARPETGYGYIEADKDAKAQETREGAATALAVASFREKPDLATAEKFVASGNFYWNSGMFFWRLDTFLGELGHAAPAMAQAVRALSAALRARDAARVDRLFESLDDISIDYALMEKTANVLMVPAGFVWDDLGSWDALDRTLARDAAGNVAVGDPVLIDVRDSIVYNEPGGEKRAVSVIGVEGLAVVVSDDAVLVVPKARAQEVKKAVAALKERGARQM